jgi:hypothetical protein
MSFEWNEIEMTKIWKRKSKFSIYFVPNGNNNFKFKNGKQEKIFGLTIIQIFLKLEFLLDRAEKLFRGRRKAKQ